MQIEILDPKARKLLKSLAELNLISITKPSEDKFLTLVNKIRSRAKNDPPSLEEITAEVEMVRSKRYASKKQGDN